LAQFIPSEPYPPFPSAYPLTPEPTRLTLQPLSATAINMIEVATRDQPFSLPVKKEETQDAPDWNGRHSDKDASSSRRPISEDPKVTALRRTLTSSEHPPTKRSRIASSGEISSHKGNKPPDNRRTVSATVVVETKAYTEDRVKPMDQIQPDMNGQRFKTTSQVPKKRLMRKESDANPRRSRRDTTNMRTTSQPLPSNVTFADADEYFPKKRKVSREASSDSRQTRTSRETSQERRTLAKSRKVKRGNRSSVVDSGRESHAIKKLERIPGSDDFDGISTISRSSRSTALASASEAYRTSRKSAL